MAGRHPDHWKAPPGTLLPWMARHETPYWHSAKYPARARNLYLWRPSMLALDHRPAGLVASPPLCRKRREVWQRGHQIQALGCQVQQLVQLLFHLEWYPARLRAQPIPRKDLIRGRRPLEGLSYSLPVRQASSFPHVPPTPAYVTRPDRPPRPPTRRGTPSPSAASLKDLLLLWSGQPVRSVGANRRNVRPPSRFRALCEFVRALRPA